MAAQTLWINHVHYDNSVPAVGCHKVNNYTTVYNLWFYDFYLGIVCLKCHETLLQRSLQKVSHCECTNRLMNNGIKACVVNFHGLTVTYCYCFHSCIDPRKVLWIWWNFHFPSVLNRAVLSKSFKTLQLYIIIVLCCLHLCMLAYGKAPCAA